MARCRDSTDFMIRRFFIPKRLIATRIFSHAGVLAGILLWSISTSHAHDQATVSQPGSAVLDFKKDVQPIFASKCLSCHGSKTQKAELDLSTPAGILRGGESGSLWDERPKDGHLYDFIRNKNMPPEDAPPLSESEIETLTRWLETGAQIPDTLEKVGSSGNLMARGTFAGEKGK